MRLGFLSEILEEHNELIFKLTHNPFIWIELGCTSG
jgi:hypothetical protein